MLAEQEAAGSSPARGAREINMIEVGSAVYITLSEARLILGWERRFKGHLAKKFNAEFAFKLITRRDGLYRPSKNMYARQFSAIDPHPLQVQEPWNAITIIDVLMGRGREGDADGCGPS